MELRIEPLEEKIAPIIWGLLGGHDGGSNGSHGTHSNGTHASDSTADSHGTGTDTHGGSSAS